jgi:cytochrome c peroxidase
MKSNNDLQSKTSVMRKNMTRLFPLNMVLIMIVAIVLYTRCGESETETEAEEPVLLDMGYLLNNKDLQVLGELLFFDENLSDPPGQSCATCHGAEVGWTGPDETININAAAYPGAVHGREGNRKPPTAAYSTYSPLFHAIVEEGEILFVGGNFWDGRATGYILGNSAADQAQQPFMNPLEQNIADEKGVVERVINSAYVNLFKKVAEEIWNYPDICSSDDVHLQFGIIGLALAAFEHSEKVSPFTSKFDYFLRGEAELTEQEKWGMDLFADKGLCADCHPMDILDDGTHPLFTDFTYDNLGIPKNPRLPFYRMAAEFNPDGENWIDPGLGDFLRQMPHYAMYADDNYGKQKVPTLRNVDKRPSPGFVKVYGHNGYFTSLEEITHFYNTRDVLPSCEDVADPQPGVNCWPKPEVPVNVNVDELGDLKLTPEEEAAIVAFMKTLSDGYVPHKK